MLESSIMTASLIVLGYGFYLISRMLWAYKSDMGLWKYMYFMLSAFIIGTFVLFSFVMFSFMTAFITSIYAINVMNIALVMFFFSGAGLIAAFSKYHVNTVSSVAEKNIKSVKLSC